LVLTKLGKRFAYLSLIDRNSLLIGQLDSDHSLVLNIFTFLKQLLLYCLELSTFYKLRQLFRSVERRVCETAGQRFLLNYFL
jgi:hypothetical protein